MNAFLLFLIIMIFDKLYLFGLCSFKPATFYDIFYINGQYTRGFTESYSYSGF